MSVSQTLFSNRIQENTSNIEVSNKITPTCISPWFIFRGSLEVDGAGVGRSNERKSRCHKVPTTSVLNTGRSGTTPWGCIRLPTFLPSPERNVFSLSLFSAAWVYPSSSELFYWSNRLSKTIIYAWMLWSKRHLLSSSTFQFFKKQKGQRRGGEGPPRFVCS